MEAIETSGKTVDEAVAKALEKLGLTREQVEISVLKKGRSGILGLGAEDAVVRVEPVSPPAASHANESQDVAVEVVSQLLSLMKVPATVEVAPPQEGNESEGQVTLDIRGDDLGILIGRRGQTLGSLQFLVRTIVSQRLKERYPLTLDVEGYKRHRYESVRGLAERMAEQVQTTGLPVTLEPMPADERRLVHVTLSDFQGVTTESLGEGESRRVTITAKNK